MRRAQERKDIMVKDMGFAEMMKDLVEDRLGNGYEVSIRDVVKNNGTELTGLSVGAKDARIAPTIYLEGIESEFEDSKISAGEAADMIVRTFKREENPDEVSILGIMQDAKEIYKRVYPKLINAERNEELLKTVPHVEFLDLAEIFVVKMELSAGTGNVTIKNDLMDMMGLDIENLKKTAHENMVSKGLYKSSLSSIIAELIGGSDEIPGLSNEQFEDSIPMTIVTNPEKFNGACCLLEKSIFAEMSEELESDLYILPSSIHEVIVVPDTDRFDKEELRHMVMDVNRTSVSEEDFLSDSIYRFDRVTEKIQVA